MKALFDSKTLTQMIGAIGKRVASTRESIQVAAVQCAGYSIVHGDIMHGVRLVDNVAKHHRAAVVAFLERSGNFAWDKKAKALVHRPTFHAESFTEARVAELVKGKSWEDCSIAPAVVSTFDVAAQLDKLIKAYENAVKDGKKEILNRGLIDAVLEAKASYSGAQMDEQIAADAE